MATVILNYNVRNLKAKNALNYILSTGWFAHDTVSKKRVYKTTKKTGINRTKEAILDVNNGKTIYCGSFENYLKATEQYA